MKTFTMSFLLAALLVALLSQYAVCQIPNAGFENWSGGEPDSWISSNAPPSIVNVTQSSDVHAGSSSAKGVVVSFSGFTIPPILSSGPDGAGFPVNSQQPALHGWYKFVPVADDYVYASVGMMSGGTAIGAGLVATSDTQNVYQEFVADITYNTSDTPDTCNIVFAIGNLSGTAHEGSTFYVDDLSFGPVTAVDEHGHVLPQEFSLRQNFPNPFNPVTRIQYAIPQSAWVQLKVYDLLGREVATLVDQRQESGSYRAEFDGSGLPSGMYIYRLQAGAYSGMGKMMLTK